MVPKAKTEKAAGKKHAGEKHDETPVAAKKTKAQKAAVEAASAKASTKTTEPQVPAPAATAQQPDDTQEIVVFAFRLTRAERDLIHETAGSAKASKFVREVSLAAARGDLEHIQRMLERGF